MKCCLKQNKRRLCTLSEAQSRDNVKRYEAIASSQFYALDWLRLKIITDKKRSFYSEHGHNYGINSSIDGQYVPKLVKGSKKNWYCTTFFIPETCETVYNTIFTIELNNLVMCYTYV